MRPDQQQGEPVGSVLTILSFHIDMREACGKPNLASELRQARDAVAEYIAANDEYDAAWHAMRYDQSSECGIRFNAARDRRAAAHARVKGETK